MPKKKKAQAMPFAVASILIILGIVAFQQFTTITIDPIKMPSDGDPCEGKALHVGYPFDGEMLKPHECKIGCDDGIWRHIVYTNGEATQCQRPPGCSDWGEDAGVTCVPEAREE